MNKRILIADDTKVWLYLYIEIIKQLYKDTFEIQPADSASDALNIILKNKINPFGIIITDLQMENDYEPMTAGEWLIENIKRLDEYSEAKIIIISSMYNIENIAEKYNVECISKQKLINNRLLMKYMFEKLMPHLIKTEQN